MKELKHLDTCLICKVPLKDKGVFRCLTCHQICDVGTETAPEKIGQPQLFDIKSFCCNSDVDILARTTCSEICHEQLIFSMEMSFGKYKKVVELETGIAHKIPTRVILERGITGKDLKDYPVWDGMSHEF